MQAWTSVLVTDPTHPRTGTAGVCQGAPFTPHESSMTRAEQLDAEATAAEQRAADARAALAELTVSAGQAEKDAKAARRAANRAATAASGAEPADNAPRVNVRFDADGEVEAVPVAALQALG